MHISLEVFSFNKASVVLDELSEMADAFCFICCFLRYVAGETDNYELSHQLGYQLMLFCSF